MDFLHSQLFVTPMYPTDSCAGQTIIVTGSNIGLGKEAARHLARLGASKVSLVVRNSKAGEEVKKNIETSTKCSADVLEVWTLDFLSYESCESFVDWASKLLHLDVLLENAGVAGHKRSLAGAINARMGEQYPTSKLLEALVVRQIAPKPEGSGVILSMLNPGLCHSELAGDAGLFLAFMKFFLARTTEVGSRTLIVAAMAGSKSHSKYMTDAQINDDALSNFVKSEDGREASERVWKN